MKARSWLKLGSFLFCGVAFLTIALQLDGDWLLPFDQRVTYALVALRSPLLTRFLSAVTELCSPVVLLAVCLTLMAVLRKKHLAIPLAIDLMVAVSLNYSLKHLFLRERPPLELHLVAEAGYSFPSGHAMAAGAFYGFLMYIVAQSGLPRRQRLLLNSLLVLIIALIGVSRVYLGVHYLSDVLAGFAVSIAYLLAYSTIVSLYLRAGQQAVAITTDGRKNKRILDSFAHALDGIAGGLKGERNMVVHFGVMALVTVFGFLLPLSKAEWLACIILFGLVIGMELLNTAIETTVDICMPHPDPRAKLAKDTAAGAVMAVSLAAAIVGILIFVPKLWPMLR